MLPELNTYDWEQAFVYTHPQEAVIGQSVPIREFSREDVAEILALSEGENDGEAWRGLFRLHDGRFAFLSAWCDYTGWDCQAGGQTVVSADMETLVRFGMTQGDRAALGKPLAEDPSP